MVKRILQWTLALTAAAGIAAVSPAAAQASSAAPAGGSKGSVTTAHACAKPLHPGSPVCYALVRTDVSAVHANALAPDATPSGYGPSDLQRAYNLASAAASNGGSATVAVAELADDPNLESDLGTYRAQYGLPACTTANGCFRKVNQSGQQGNYPPGDTGWGTEASLDVDMVSAVCPQCHILVVEAGDLNAAQNTAVSLGAHFISNSWGTGDGSFDAGADADFNHAGVVDVASSGDSGYGVSFPATSQYVVAAGGTSLRSDSGTARGWSETVWSGAGAGCSSWEAKPSWQHDSGCGNRTVADVSAVADPGTGVAVYDTYGQGGWFVVGGTSVSSPIIASVFALAGAPSGAAASTLYAHSSSLNDVTSGSDGSCSPSYLCTGTAGYDGPTGLGTPNGLGAFNGSGSATHTGQVTSGVDSSLCLDDSSSSTANFNPIQIWGCNGTGAQAWTVSGNTLQVLGKCLDVNAAGTADGTTVDLYDCNGTVAQVWQPQANGSLLNPNSGKCLDDPNSSTTWGTQLQIWDCNNTGAQHWALP
ncbi:S53 family peptidase [Actinacidiphila rubida]|uniref:Ricin-type beta-trefoil lectin domain-containing protein n=1 Tax=Actinacidiphila rubida TaxID=310780 RepID=A0A1H8T9A0_9ACTN|nr:S53 family peptidase [Actinacidiphila rubida]SEO87073.1 Ricin-type beta-trefoil lectin domain-containing protein [Actinacidiphila rubida]